MKIIFNYTWEFPDDVFESFKHIEERVEKHRKEVKELLKCDNDEIEIGIIDTN